jgi:superfamily II DNA/RNA helicase
MDEHDNNLLLIAPTGSGKTLAYLLPALSKAVTTDGTVLVVAPTRELAVQLQRDAVSLLANLNIGAEEEQQDSIDAAANAVILAVRGVPPPTPLQLEGATVLIGTPSELLQVLKTTANGPDFIAADTLRAVVLDEVDVLLPLAPKTFRTNLDNTKNKDGRKTTNPAEKERRRQQEERQRDAQKRKLLAAKRAGTQLTADSKNIVLPTELLLRLVAESRSSFVGGDAAIAAAQPPPQVLAGSATASRRTLDRLNRAMRAASAVANSDFDLVWSSDVTVCRPIINNDENDNNDATENNKKEGGDSDAAQHTIRAVTVPSQVKHRYISLSKESASSSDDVLSAVAKAANIMKPQSALVFLCGEFAKSNVKIKQETVMPLGRASKTSTARRDSKRKYEKAIAAAKAVSKTVSSDASLLSARKTCDVLGKFGIEAQPLHVALGLEQNGKEEEDEDAAPFLVTFEGSARGLHFDGVDAVFIVGRPVSAASYLHLAGRVGRSSTSDADDGSVFIRPGTVVSICTKGSATELDKWTRQIGGTCLEELVL